MSEPTPLMLCRRCGVKKPAECFSTARWSPANEIFKGLCWTCYEATYGPRPTVIDPEKESTFVRWGIIILIILAAVFLGFTIITELVQPKARTFDLPPSARSLPFN